MKVPNISLRDILARCNFIRAGLGIVLLSFTLAAINGLLPQPVPYLQAMGIQLNIIGMGTLLFGIGRHLHYLHLNILRMNDWIYDETMGVHCES